MENYILCPSETMMIHRDEIISEDNYKLVFASIYGCDSVQLWSVKQIDAPPEPTMYLNSEDESITMTLPDTLGDDWAIKWSKTSDGDQTNYEVIKGEEHVHLNQQGSKWYIHLIC